MNSINRTFDLTNRNLSKEEDKKESNEKDNSVNINTNRTFDFRSFDLAQIQGKLPYAIEMPTNRALDVLQKIVKLEKGESRKDLRKRLCKWLYQNARKGFYIEITSSLHLAYADQRRGNASQHYWRFFYASEHKKMMEILANKFSLKIDKLPSYPNVKPSEASRAKRAVSKDFESRKLLFFTDISAYSYVNFSENLLSEKEEINKKIYIDFMIFKNGKCAILVIDKDEDIDLSYLRTRDYSLDVIARQEKVPILRFTAQECLQKTATVVDRLVALL